MNMPATEHLIIEHLDLWTSSLKRKSTAGRGSASKVDLYGIKKLRELVVELAVRGLLVPQDPTDEPASDLLRRIASEKSKLANEGTTRIESPLPPIGDAEELFPLPSGWARCRLADVSLLSEAGWSPKCEEVPRVGSDWGVLKVSAVTWGAFNPAENKALPANLNAVPEYEVRPGDFLISRANTADLVARSVVVPDDVPPKLMMSDKIIRFKFSREVSASYLSLFNNSAGARRYYLRVAGGTSSSMKNVSRLQIQSLVIALPPLAEQQHIVAKVDELMALCDGLEQQTDASLSAHQTLVETLLNPLTHAADHAQFASGWKRTADHFDALFTTEESIDQLKQTILQLAVMGKLVQQNPDDEPANELLGRVVAERALLMKEGKINKEKPFPPVNNADVPFELPRGWQWERLPNVCFFQEGPGIMAKDFRDEGVPLIRISGMRGPVVSLDGCNFLDEEMVAKKWNHFRLEANDIVLSSSASLGKVSKVGHDAVGSIVYTGLIRFKPFSSMLDEYLIRFLGSSEFARQIDGSKRGAAILHFGPTHLRGMIVPVPPLPEQHRIVAKVDELMAMCNQLASGLGATQTTKLRLADALTERALAAA